MIRATPLRAVVFDLDGTLLDTLPLVLASIAHALEPFGRPPPADLFARLGGPPERFLPLLLEDPAQGPEALARMDAYHRANPHRVAAFDGAVRLLEELRCAGLAAAIWTGRDRRSTGELLRMLGLHGYFAAVLCGDDLPTHKPDPAGLRELLRRLAVSPVETLFVGDADVDVLGGRACGVDTILIRHARDIAREIVAQSWRTVGTPAEAYDLVAACGANGSPPATSSGVPDLPRRRGRPEFSAPPSGGGGG